MSSLEELQRDHRRRPRRTEEDVAEVQDHVGLAHLADRLSAEVSDSRCAPLGRLNPTI